MALSSRPVKGKSQDMARNHEDYMDGSEENAASGLFAAVTYFSLLSSWWQLRRGYYSISKSQPCLMCGGWSLAFQTSAEDNPGPTA